MGANGVKADVHSYNVALAALKHRGLWQQVRGVAYRIV